MSNLVRSYTSLVIVLKEGEVIERFDGTELFVENGGFFIVRGDVRLDLGSVVEPTVLTIETLLLKPVRELLEEHRFKALRWEPAPPGSGPGLWLDRARRRRNPVLLSRRLRRRSGGRFRS